MKTFKLLSVFVFSLIFCTSCEEDDWFCTTGNGYKTERSSHYAYFDRVHLDFNADVYIRQGSTSETRVVASENLINSIEEYVFNGELYLGVKSGHCINEVNGKVKIYVTSLQYEALKLSGSGSIQSESALDLNDLEIDLIGRGDVVLSNVAVDDYDIEIDGSGDVFMQGPSANNGTINIDGSGDANLEGLLTNTVNVNIEGRGDANLNVVNTLNVNISGTGIVRYDGNPNVSSSVIGGGKVIKN